jgi:hypothetical protein
MQRKFSAEYSEAANLLESLAEIFNDYRSFEPQNLIAQYIMMKLNAPPERPYAASFLTGVT